MPPVFSNLGRGVAIPRGYQSYPGAVPSGYQLYPGANQIVGSGGGFSNQSPVDPNQRYPGGIREGTWHGGAIRRPGSAYGGGYQSYPGTGYQIPVGPPPGGGGGFQQPIYGGGSQYPEMGQGVNPFLDFIRRRMANFPIRAY